VSSITEKLSQKLSKNDYTNIISQKIIKTENKMFNFFMGISEMTITI